MKPGGALLALTTLVAPVLADGAFNFNMHNGLMLSPWLLATAPGSTTIYFVLPVVFVSLSFLLLFIRICCLRRQTVVVYRTLPNETTVVRVREGLSAFFFQMVFFLNGRLTCQCQGAAPPAYGAIGATTTVTRVATIADAPPPYRAS